MHVHVYLNTSECLREKNFCHFIFISQPYACRCRRSPFAVYRFPRSRTANAECVVCSISSCAWIYASMRKSFHFQVYMHKWISLLVFVCPVMCNFYMRTLCFRSYPTPCGPLPCCVALSCRFRMTTAILICAPLHFSVVSWFVFFVFMWRLYVFGGVRVCVVFVLVAFTWLGSTYNKQWLRIAASYSPTHLFALVCVCFCFCDCITCSTHTWCTRWHSLLSLLTQC